MAFPVHCPVDPVVVGVGFPPWVVVIGGTAVEPEAPPAISQTYAFCWKQLSTFHKPLLRVTDAHLIPVTFPG